MLSDVLDMDAASNQSAIQVRVECARQYCYRPLRASRLDDEWRLFLTPLPLVSEGSSPKVCL
jgi:hypothetical protein